MALEEEGNFNWVNFHFGKIADFIGNSSKYLGLIRNFASSAQELPAGGLLGLRM